MIRFLLDKIQGRSPKWSKVRKEFLSKPENKTCNCCNSRNKLEVHHIIPFGVSPELELDLKNIISLCKYCHLIIGHFGNFKLYNPCVLDDCHQYHLKLITKSKRIKPAI